MAYIGYELPDLEPGEVRTVSFSFSSPLAAGETVASVLWGMASMGVCDPYAYRCLSGQLLSGSNATVKLSGMKNNVRYIVEAQATTSLGNVYSLFSHIACKLAS